MSLILRLFNFGNGFFEANAEGDWAGEGTEGCGDGTGVAV